MDNAASKFAACKYEDKKRSRVQLAMQKACHQNVGERLARNIYSGKEGGLC